MASLLAMGLLLGYFLFADHQRITDWDRDRLSLQCRVIGENLESQFGGIYNALIGVRRDLPQLRHDSGWQVVSHRLEALRDAMPAVSSMHITDAFGKILAADRPETIGINLGAREYFGEARDNPDPNIFFVSPPFRTINGLFSLNFVLTVVDPQGQFSGVISATLDPAFFRTLLSSVLSTPDMWVAIAHWDGLQFFLHPPRPEMEGLNLAVPGSFFSRHRESGRLESQFSGTTYATGEKRLMALRTIQPAKVPMDKPLVVGMGRSLDAVYAEWRLDLKALLLMFVIIALASALGLAVYQRKQKESAFREASAQAALQESEFRYRRMVETANEGVWFIDKTGTTTFVNQKMAAMLGYSPEEMLGKKPEVFIHPEDLGTFSASMESRRLGASETTERRYRRKDGATIWVNASAVPAFDESGNYSGSFAMFTDITDRKRAEEALRDSQQLLATTLESISDGFFSLDHSLVVTYFNQAAGRLLGRKPDEVLGRPLFDAFPEARGSVFEEKYTEALSDRRILYFETFFGVEPYVNWFDVRVYPQPQGISVFFQVTTERKQAEKALRVSEEKFRKLAETIGEVFWLGSPDWNQIHYISPAFERVWGIPCSRLYQHPRIWTEAIFPEDQETIQAAIPRQVAPGHEVAFPDYRIRRPDGSVRWIAARAFPIADESGQVYQVAGIAEDITERKLAEEALEKRLLALSQPLDDVSGISFHDLFNLDDIQRIQDLFAKATGVASIITHPDGTPITQASEFCKLCSEIIRKTEIGRKNCFASDAIIGRHHPQGPIVQTCLSGGLWDAGASITVGGKHLANWLIGQIRNEAQGEQAMRDYARAIGADEEEFIAAFNEVPIMSEAHFRQVAEALFALAKQLSTVAYQNVQQARFITERNKAEEEKAITEAQLRQAQKMEAIGTLAGGIAHDFNNILGVILGYAEIIRDESASGKVSPGDVDQIISAAERARELVRQILTFSRKMEPERKPLDLNLELRRAMDLLGHTLPKMISTELRLAPDLWRVGADANLLSQVIFNLSTNAYHAMPEGGKLTISTENVTFNEKLCDACGETYSGDWVGMTISDTGLGISPQDLPRIFDPFFTTKEVGKGTGLGLSMVHGIVLGHGGHIECQSQVGKGTTIVVYLPALDGAAEVVAFDGDEKIGELPGGRETILLVDDEESLRKLGTRTLKSKGYEVATAGSGEEALELYRQKGELLDLVIMDLGMPGMGGHKAMKAILEVNPAAKVIVASGYSIQGRAKGAMEDGAAGYVGKPFKKAELLLAVRSVLDKK